ncbi:hypothetical protein ACFX5U_06095 [Sphingobacterium sp. SG20118]|uniref:hypothetical protein n=1 Tax=Sphingobacterium sp. SG20118 TaxID=3367156 RepID=UPI0037DFC9B3
MKGIFREWVPEWLIKLILFSCLMPSMVLFFLPGANIQVTAGYYGSQPSDIQFLIILFYAGFVGFYILERRFFLFFPVKQYYVIFNLLQVLNCYLMYSITDITWVYGLRFIQGMLFASAVNLSISMIFSRLNSERAKEVSYSIFFGMLLCSSPFNSFVTAEFIDSFNFDELYLYAALAFVPGLLLVLISMKSTRHVKPYPLFSLDWPSCVFFSGLIIAFGYMMVYGQEVYWFLGFTYAGCTISRHCIIVLFCHSPIGFKTCLCRYFYFHESSISFGLTDSLYDVHRTIFPFSFQSIFSTGTQSRSNPPVLYAVV